MNKQDILSIILYILLAFNLITIVLFYTKIFIKKSTKEESVTTQVSNTIEKRDASTSTDNNLTDTEHNLIFEYRDTINHKSHKSVINEEIFTTFTYIKDKSHFLFKNKELVQIVELFYNLDENIIFKIPDNKNNEFVNLVRLVKSDKLITQNILEFYSPTYLYIVVYNFFSQIKLSEICLFYMVTRNSNENIMRNILSNMICSSMDQIYDERVLEEINKEEVSNRESVYNRQNCIVKMEVYINFLRIFFNKKNGSYITPEDLITFKNFAIKEGWYEKAIEKFSKNKILDFINKDVLVYWKDEDLNITFLDVLMYVYEKLFEDCKELKAFNSTKNCSKENEEIYKNSYL